MTHVPRRSVLFLPGGLASGALLAACGGSDGGSTSATGAPGPRDVGGETFIDGEYEARGTYGGGPSYIDVAVTLESGSIAAVTVTPLADDETSLGYQERFAEAVPGEVIGRRVDEVELGRTAGSSTTPDGFNDALAQIRAEASS